MIALLEKANILKAETGFTFERTFIISTSKFFFHPCEPNGRL